MKQVAVSSDLLTLEEFCLAYDVLPTHAEAEITAGRLQANGWWPEISIWRQDANAWLVSRDLVYDVDGGAIVVGDMRVEANTEIEVLDMKFSK